MINSIELRNCKTFFGMVLAAAFGGILVTIPVTFIGGQGIFEASSFGDWGDLVGAFMGMAVGYPLGVVLSTQVFSRVFKYRDSMRLAPLGAAMGVVLIFGLAEPSNLDTNASVLLSSYFLVTALLATWGFHLKKV